MELCRKTIPFLTETLNKCVVRGILSCLMTPSTSTKHVEVSIRVVENQFQTINPIVK